MASRNTTKQEKEIYSKLDNIKDNSIYEWLGNIKLNGTDSQSRVENPLSGSKIFTNKEGIYPIIIKWCFKKFTGYDFTGVPNALNILSNMTASTSLVASSAARATKAKSPDIDIISIAKEWKDNPMINPLTGATIQVSINPKSEYVELYAKLIDKLVKHFLQNGKKMLTIKDCKTIKDSMPNMHAIYHITDGNNNIIDSIFYDHLFMTKFITLKGSKSANKYSYDNDYLKEIEPYLYLNMYKAITDSLKKSRVTTYDNVVDLLIYIEPINTDFSIGILVDKLCIDIKNILYMHESKITEEKINAAIYNKEVLKYYIKIYQLTLTNLDLRKEIINYYNNFAKYYISYNNDKKNQLNNTNYIYYQISNHVSKDTNICKTLLSVYDSILKLYSDNNIKNTKYKYIKDPFNTNKNIEPILPIKPQLNQDLHKYKMRLSLANAVIDEEKDIALKEYHEKEDEWKKQFKEYVKKKEIYDRIGKITPKQRKGVWNGSPLKVKTNAYKDDNIIEATKALSAKYHNKVLKAYTTSSHLKNDNTSSKAPKVSFVKFDKITKTFITYLDKQKQPKDDKDKKNYYVNDTDPNTQEDFEDMHPNKQKYTCDIVHYDENNRVFHFRFDTVNLYNYILKCIEYCEKPINPITKAELNNENLNEICNKIKYFTKKPTYNTSLDIRALLDNCKYDNLLAFDYSIDHLPQWTSNPIIGRLNIHLNISLGGILFRVINSYKLPPNVSIPDNYPNQTDRINSTVITFPVFADYITDIYDEASYTYPVYILSDLQQKLPNGNMIGNRYFPYRKNNSNGQQWNDIITLPVFDLNILDDADKAFAKLKKYKDEIALL
jgi:hypothetical protein